MRIGVLAGRTAVLLGALCSVLLCCCCALCGACFYKRRRNDKKEEGRKSGGLAAEVELGNASVDLGGSSPMAAALVNPMQAGGAVAQLQGPWVIDGYLPANVVNGVGTVEINGKEHPPSAICVDESGKLFRADGWFVAPGSNPIDGPVVWTKDGVEVMWERPGASSRNLMHQDWDPSHAPGALVSLALSALGQSTAL